MAIQDQVKLHTVQKPLFGSEIFMHIVESIHVYSFEEASQAKLRIKYNRFNLGPGYQSNTSWNFFRITPGTIT